MKNRLDVVLLVFQILFLIMGAMLFTSFIVLGMVNFHLFIASISCVGLSFVLFAYNKRKSNTFLVEEGQKNYNEYIKRIKLEPKNILDKIFLDYEGKAFAEKLIKKFPYQVLVELYINENIPGIVILPKKSSDFKSIYIGDNVVEIDYGNNLIKTIELSSSGKDNYTSTDEIYRIILAKIKK